MAVAATGMKDTRLVERYFALLLHPLPPGAGLPGGWRMALPEPAGRVRIAFEKPGELTWFLLLGPRNDQQDCLARSRNLNLSVEGQVSEEARRLLRFLVPLIQKNDQRVHPASAQKVFGLVRDAGVKSVDFSIQPVCNNNCVFCSNQPSTIGQFGTEEVLQRIEQEFAGGANWLEFSAMEPTLRKDLPQLIQKGVELGFDGIHVISNGQNFMNRKLAERIIHAGVTKITVSIHSCDDETETAITRHPGSLAKKKAGIKNILDIFGERFPQARHSFQLPLYTNTILNRLNYALFPDTVDMLMDLGVGRIHVFFPRIIGSAHRDFDEVVPDMSAVAPYVNEAVRRGKARGALMAVCDLPACVLDETDGALNYRLKKEVRLTREEGGGLKDFHWDVEQEKVKTEDCARCRHNVVCEGVFAEYVRRRGWAEFVPVA